MSARIDSLKAGDPVEVRSGILLRRRYPGSVERVTPAQIIVSYDASSTGGLKKIVRRYWKRDGFEVGSRLSALSKPSQQSSVAKGGE